MLTSTFAGLGFTRDDVKWTVGVVAAVIIGIAALGNTVTEYGIPATCLPYIRLAALIIGIVSAKYMSSNLPADPAKTK